MIQKISNLLLENFRVSSISSLNAQFKQIRNSKIHSRIFFNVVQKQVPSPKSSGCWPSGHEPKAKSKIWNSMLRVRNKNTKPRLIFKINFICLAESSTWKKSIFQNFSSTISITSTDTIPLGQALVITRDVWGLACECYT